MKAGGRPYGFTLIELLIAMGIGAFLIAGIMRLAQAATAGFQVQQALAQVQENARFLTASIEAAIRQSGYRPQPWQPVEPGPAIAPGTREGFLNTSDRLELRRWSDRNCFDHANPALDTDGNPRFFLLYQSYHANATGSLAHTCQYGPAEDQLITQINNLGLADGVEALQAQFAVDRNDDGNADRWIRAGQWQAEDRLLGVRFALLLASPFPAGDKSTRQYQVLDQWVDTPADGRLRGVFQATVAIQGRTR